MDSLPDVGFSSPPLSGSVFASACSFSSSSSSPQNLLANEDDLYGADLHLVNKKAFFGGVDAGETKTLAASSPFSSSSFSVSRTKDSLLSPNFESFSKESPLILLFLRKLPRKNNTHLHQTGFKDLGLSPFPLKRRQKQPFLSFSPIHLHRRLFGAPVLFPGCCCCCCFDDRLTRTWPMHVTFGEVGSCVSMAALFFLSTNIGLERDLPLLLLPTLLLKNRISGGGYFSARPGLDMGLVVTFIFIGEDLLY
ncbi:hypothetical protein CICLE_v10012558mg [Citrus x clementina]|uniref:Uncharacterized protein n=1 Tax=Citrus clementina TaxID=85681 RepID=V4S3V8_CITCL|nr:hypothetical protein CICLE_v10012558mg [Citrus x clementina]